MDRQFLVRKRKFGENLKLLILKIENMIPFFKNNIIKLLPASTKNFEEGSHLPFTEIALIDFHSSGIAYSLSKLFR